MGVSRTTNKSTEHRIPTMMEDKVYVAFEQVLGMTHLDCLQAHEYREDFTRISDTSQIATSGGNKEGD